MRHTVLKGWGYELHVVNKPEYCGKLLVFNKGKRCSWHMHKVKDEVFFLIKGRMIVLWSDVSDDINEAESLLLEVRDSFHVPVGRRHRMIALEDSELIEFSTQHFDSDSYRIEKGD